MATEKDNLAKTAHSPKRQWLRPLARRVAATFIICALIAIGLSQVVTVRPSFRQAPDTLVPRGLRLIPLAPSPHSETRQEIIYFDTTSQDKFQTTPEVKPAPISPDSYKLHLDQ
jgi:hypothetical protein